MSAIPADTAIRARNQEDLDAETRARIEQAVLDVFSGREFHRVGLIEIARAANVSLQTIYKYYGSKEALLFSSLDSWLGRLAHRMIDHLQGIEDYKEKLRKVFWVVLDFFEKNPKAIAAGTTAPTHLTSRVSTVSHDANGTVGKPLMCAASASVKSVRAATAMPMST